MGRLIGTAVSWLFTSPGPRRCRMTKPGRTGSSSGPCQQALARLPARIVERGAALAARSTATAGFLVSARCVSVAAAFRLLAVAAAFLLARPGPPLRFLACAALGFLPVAAAFLATRPGAAP